MSLRDWQGAYAGQLGMTDWEWVYAFGRHMPGGDRADPAIFTLKVGRAPAMQDVGTGRDQLLRHSQSAEYDHSEWVRLILRQNFRGPPPVLSDWAISAAWARVWLTIGVLRGLNRDDSVFAVPPHVVYDMRHFDARTAPCCGSVRRVMKLLELPLDTQVGMPHKDLSTATVHLRAGMSCADCHSNGENHAIARGLRRRHRRQDGQDPRQRELRAATWVRMLRAPPALRAAACRHSGQSLQEPELHDLSLGVTEDGALAEVRTRAPTAWASTGAPARLRRSRSWSRSSCATRRAD